MDIAVSVIIPIYNVAPYIERCTRSLMEQIYRNVEFIFVDDCSPDNSIEILQKVIKEYPERIPFIKIIRNKQNKGLAETRFIGMDEAQGEYILHCDSDDWIETDMLEIMYKKAVSENADIVCCEVVKERSDGKYFCYYDYDEETLENGLLDLRVEEIRVAIWNKLIKKELYTLNNIRNYEGINMGEDSALTIRLRYFSKKTVIIHKPLYHYNRMNNNSMVANIKEASIQEKIKLAKNIETFFKNLNEEERFRTLINFYKFDSKQFYLRIYKDINKWKEIFPESHKDIFKFRHLTFIGRIKWWLCAYFPFTNLLIRHYK